MMNVFTMFKVKKLRVPSIQRDSQINNEDSNRKGTLASSRQEFKLNFNCSVLDQQRTFGQMMEEVMSR